MKIPPKHVQIPSSKHFFSCATKQRYMGIQMQTRSTWEYEVEKKKKLARATTKGEKEVI